MSNEFWLWVGFNVFVLVALGLDLGIMQRNAHEIKWREAVLRSLIWLILAMIFCAGIYFSQGYEPALNFFTGYLIEKSLSIDNLFVFLTLFSYFAVPKKHIFCILFWGIIGAIILRAIFIFIGIALFNMFHWMTYVFGVILLFAGFQLARGKTEEIHPEHNPILKLLRKFIRITPSYVNNAFFIKKSDGYWATPLFVVLVSVETTDIAFAIDSVPAVFGITTDPFIVYTSNVFAILGLRSLYFALENVLSAFRYLHYGLAAILAFIGIKMLISGYVKIPILVTLAVIIATLAVSILLSLREEKPT